MNKEQIQTRLDQLTVERDQAKATLLAYEGAIQDCTYWLSVSESPVEEVNKET